MIAQGERVELELPFDQQHNLLNSLAALAAARAIGVQPSGTIDVRFSSMRGERVATGIGVGRHQRLLQRQPALHARRP